MTAPRPARAVVALCLDYDGTLAPIATHPSRARLPADLKRLLGRLCRRPEVRLAVISGRALRDLRQVVGVPGIHYVGNHGLECQGPGLRYVHPGARAARAVLRRARDRLRAELAAFRGVWVEDKDLTLTVHVRAAAPAGRRAAGRHLRFLARPPYRRRVRVTTGKMVWEVHPRVRWDKGSAVRWLLAHWRGRLRTPVVPIYLGDDRTDESAFRVVRRQGIAVRVGPSRTATGARYRLISPRAATRFLASVERLLAARVWT